MIIGGGLLGALLGVGQVVVLRRRAGGRARRWWWLITVWLGVVVAAALWRHGWVELLFVVPLALVAGPLAVIDYEEHRLPNLIIFPWAGLLAVLTLALWATGAAPSAAAGVAGGGAASAVLYLGIYALHRGRLGEGDVKLGICLGGSTGAVSSSAWFTAHIAGLALVAACTAVMILRGHRGASLPWGPPLLAGAVLAVLAP